MGISTTEKKRIATHEKFQLFFKCVYIINKRIHGRLEFFAKLSNQSVCFILYRHFLVQQNGEILILELGLVCQFFVLTTF